MSELKQTFTSFDGVKQEIGVEAREYLLSMIAKSDLVELKCSDGMDKYGRLTCDVFDDKGESINL